MTLRQPCPPGACVCNREQLLEAPGADLRILQLTRQQEKILLERLENQLPDEAERPAEGRDRQHGHVEPLPYGGQDGATTGPYRGR